jgi:MFS family permease
METAPPQTERPSSLARAGLVRYLTAATLARSADGGAAVGLVLLALSAWPGRHGSLVGGILATCLTAPHLLGPVLARRLDNARDGRGVLAVAFGGYAVAIGAATLTVGRVPLAVTAALVVLAGLCGPLLTGGLSSRLAALVPVEERAQRRAQGWDAVTYGVGGTAGPAAVAGLAALAGPYVSMSTLAASAAVAALAVLTLPPKTRSNGGRDAAMPVARALRMMATTGPLRRLTYATLLTAMPLGAMSVLSVASGEHLKRSSVAGAVLAASFGLGNLAGSLVMTAFPATGEPERLITRWAFILGLGFALCAVIPGYPPAIAAFALVGALNAPFFTATLAARSAYSPAEARAQVFVSSAGLKVAAQSLGTAAAGALLGVWGAQTLLLCGAVLIVLTAAATILDRRSHPAVPASM